MASRKFTCPQCGHRNFSFDTTKLVGQCFSCGTKGAGKVWLDKLGGVQEAHRPRTVHADFEAPALRAPTGEALSYLATRGVGKGLAESAGIKWDGTYLYFPIWSPFGGTSWVRRALTQKVYYSDAPPGVPYLFGKRDIKDRIQCVLVEGVFDLLAPGLWGGGFAILGSNIDGNLERWLRAQHFGELVLWLDADETGFKKAHTLHPRLQQWHPNVVRVHGWCFDTRDPGDYRVPEGRELIHAAKVQGVPLPCRY